LNLEVYNTSYSDKENIAASSGVNCIMMLEIFALVVYTVGNILDLIGLSKMDHPEWIYNTTVPEVTVNIGCIKVETLSIKWRI